MALAEKGLSISCHAELPGGDQLQSTETQGDSAQARAARPSENTSTSVADTSHDIVIDEDGGIDL